MECEPDMDASQTASLRLVEAGVPVLRATAAELARMARDPDRTSAQALALAILRDPLMTLRLLRFSHDHRSRSQTVEITTVTHALMMLGQARLFRELGTLPIVEEQASRGGDAARRAREAMSRARLASLFARDWAVQRHDMDPEEVMVAALLRDVAEPLAELAGEPESAVHGADAFRTAFLEHLQLPAVVRALNEPDAGHDPRTLNVRLACALARHCSDGWDTAAVAQALAQVQRLLRMSAPELWERVRRVALQAAREWRVYDVRPAAAYLPMMGAWRA
jgi:hypothetical protein